MARTPLWGRLRSPSRRRWLVTSGGRSSIRAAPHINNGRAAGVTSFPLVKWKEKITHSVIHQYATAKKGCQSVKKKELSKSTIFFSLCAFFFFNSCSSKIFRPHSKMQPCAAHAVVYCITVLWFLPTSAAPFLPSIDSPAKLARRPQQQQQQQRSGGAFVPGHVLGAGAHPRVKVMAYRSRPSRSGWGARRCAQSKQRGANHRGGAARAQSHLIGYYQEADWRHGE